MSGVQGDEVVQFAVTLPVSEDTLADGRALEEAIRYRMAHPLTAKERRAIDEMIELEMAACPHVRCTCGWHEE